MPFYLLGEEAASDPGFFQPFNYLLFHLDSSLSLILTLEIEFRVIFSFALLLLLFKIDTQLFQATCKSFVILLLTMEVIDDRVYQLLRIADLFLYLP